MPPMRLARSSWIVAGALLLWLGLACAGGSAMRGQESRFEGRIQIQGDAEVIVVDALGRVDSLAYGPSSAGSRGIPGCERDEDFLPQLQAEDDTTEFQQEPVTGFGFTDASVGRYWFWMRPRRDQDNVRLLWERWIGTSSCGSSLLVDKWKQGHWYQWQVEIRPPSKSDTCGVKVGALVVSRPPKLRP